MGDNYRFHLKNACNERIALAPFAALLGHYGQNFRIMSINCSIVFPKVIIGFPSVWKPSISICIIILNFVIHDVNVVLLGLYIKYFDEFEASQKCITGKN